FIHGLCETDDAWGLGSLPSYGSRLRSDLGYTPLYLRYNSGLHISDNGRRLAALLEETVESWPVPVEEIALVGHSMGGLGARCTEVPFLDCATYYFVGATITQSTGSLVGDLLVRYPSASGSGRRRRIPFEVDNGMHLGGAHHLQLLNHPAVYDQIVRWLAGRG